MYHIVDLISLELEIILEFDLLVNKISTIYYHDKYYFKSTNGNVQAGTKHSVQETLGCI